MELRDTAAGGTVRIAPSNGRGFAALRKYGGLRTWDYAGAKEARSAAILLTGPEARDQGFGIASDVGHQPVDIRAFSTR